MKKAKKKKINPNAKEIDHLKTILRMTKVHIKNDDSNLDKFFINQAVKIENEIKKLS